jgi:hypothetical protein
MSSQLLGPKGVILIIYTSYLELISVVYETKYATTSTFRATLPRLLAMTRT